MWSKKNDIIFSSVRKAAVIAETAEAAMVVAAAAAAVIAVAEDGMLEVLVEVLDGTEGAMQAVAVDITINDIALIFGIFTNIWQDILLKLSVT